MCAEYLESHVDSIIVRDDSFKPVCILGGIELLDNLRKNPTRDFQYASKVGEIMMRGFSTIDSNILLIDLIQSWKNSGRAFSIILNEYGDCSTVSARRLLDLGAKCSTDATVSSLTSRKAITCRKDATLGEILELMYKNKVRKLLLEDSHQFISDRLILSEISKILRFEPDVDNFIDLPVGRFKLAEAVEVEAEMHFNQLCVAMQAMDHPLVLSGDAVLTPWDICLGLISPNVGGIDPAGKNPQNLSALRHEPGLKHTSWFVNSEFAIRLSH
jgi:CBS-domain-containing membrane protein